jgi:hypothetical protein
MTESIRGVLRELLFKYIPHDGVYLEVDIDSAEKQIQKIMDKRIEEISNRGEDYWHERTIENQQELNKARFEVDLLKEQLKEIKSKIPSVKEIDVVIYKLMEQNTRAVVRAVEKKGHKNRGPYSARDAQAIMNTSWEDIENEGGSFKIEALSQAIHNLLTERIG